MQRAEEKRGSKGRAPSAVVVVTALLLAGYLGVVVLAWASPSSDPQRGMADGFLMLVTLFLLGLAALLWTGASHRRPRMVWTVFATCALPSLSVVARGAIYWCDG